MPDVFTKAKRSEGMSRIRGRGNRTTEIALVKIFRTNGITGWRRHQPLPGKPDFLFRRERVAVFVDGCFWHCCPRCYKSPKSNRKFWDAKFAGNRGRDRRVVRELRQRGWSVLRVWEHGLRRPARVLARIQANLEPQGNRKIRSGTLVETHLVAGQSRTAA